MNKRFTNLVSKYLDSQLNEKENAEFTEFLKDPLCVTYFNKAVKADKVIEEVFRMTREREEKRAAAAGEEAAAAGAGKKKPGYSEQDDIEEQVKEDIIKYGGMRNPETVAAVKRMHQNMLIRRKNIRRLVFSSVAAALLIGLAIIFKNPTLTSPQKLSEKYYERFQFINLPGFIESNKKYDKASLAYIKFDYSLSAQICRDILASGNPDPDVHFLYGLNLITSDSLESALQQFSAAANLISEKDKSLYVPVHWYSALCYLSMGKSNAALRELEMIRGKDYKGLNEFDVEGLIGRINGLRWR